MAEYLKVSTARMGSDAEVISGYVREMRTQLEELRLLECRLAALWSGAPAEELNASFRKELDTVEAMMTELEQLCGYEEEAGKQYVSGERKVGAIIGKIRV